jgi:flavin reductase (DIM6/NTAB) family NADH-FMN oxidoreductase RutF
VTAGPEAFESLVGELDYPMLIVPATGGGERDGCLVGFATQCSIHPARFLACVSDKNRTYRIAQEADTVAGEHRVEGLAAFPFSRAKGMKPGHEP